MNHEAARSALRRLAGAADRHAAGLPLPTVEHIEARADSRQFGLVPRLAVAAALLFAVAGAFSYLRAPSGPEPVPAHVAVFVDSLYRSADYPVDDLARFWAPELPVAGFLESVWSAVSEGLIDS